MIQLKMEEGMGPLEDHHFVPLLNYLLVDNALGFGQCVPVVAPLLCVSWWKSTGSGRWPCQKMSAWNKIKHLSLLFPGNTGDRRTGSKIPQRVSL